MDPTLTKILQDRQQGEATEYNVLQTILGRDVAQPELPIRPPTSQYEQISEHDELVSRVARNMDVWFTNPWAMIEDGVIYTLDSADIVNPIKPFPANPWLETVVSYWLQDKLFLVPKSRRLLLSWLMVFLHLHLAMFNEGVSVYFVSDKEEKSDELVKRAEFLIKYIPDDQFLKPKYVGTYCHLKFPGLNSFIHGIPMGAGQLRQYTATAIFADEFAFWKLARETYMGSIPTIQGGGRFTGVSSPQEGFFKDMCFDQIK